MIADLISLKKIPDLSIIIFFRQLSTLISSDIPILKSIEILEKTQKNLFFKTIISDLKLNIDKGYQLSEILIKYPKYFDNLTCYLINLGEKSGTFEKILIQITEHKEQILQLSKKIKKLLFYPAIVFIIAILMCFLMLFYIVPQFEKLFNDMNTPLPLFTALVINISNLVSKYMCLFFILSIFIVTIFKKEIKFLYNRHKVQMFILNIPIISMLIKYNLIIKFTKYMSLVLKAGVSITESIPLIANTTHNTIFQKKLYNIKKEIEKGNNIYHTINGDIFFPNLFIEMIRIGEESGKLEAILDKLVLIYETELDQKIGYLIDLIEPLIMLTLGVLIGGIVIAMYLPIFKIGNIL
ncbi:type II secretion system F family protein [Gammaproteobacteria bacterium]|nr:type II secretion system F family protein [Gammaproteobacteria bacterium]